MSNRNKKPDSVELLELPAGTDPELWDEFLELRVAKKAVQTNNAYNRQVRVLLSCQARGQSPNHVIQQALEREWHGLRPLKDDFVPDPEHDVELQDDYDAARAVIAYFNAIAKMNHEPLYQYLTLIDDRIRERGIVAVLAVTQLKTAQWREDPKMRQYLRPTTLYTRDKFHQYIGSLPPDALKNREIPAQFEQWVTNER